MIYQQILNLDYNPLIAFFTLVLLMFLALYLYLKVRRFLLSVVVFVFSLIIGINALSQTDIPFTPMIQIFFLVFQICIILIMSVEAYNSGSTE